MTTSRKGVDFARGILEKYGWKEGQGLGRNENGIVKAVKPVLKFDKAGIGHTWDISEQYTSQWWEQAYNKVAKNITVVTNKESIQVTQKNTEDLLKKCKYACPPCAYVRTDYNSFVKKSVLTNAEVVNMAEPSSSGTIAKEEVTQSKTPRMSDEEIFRACGGRTVHKGARHGLKLSGKLARIQRQEDELLQKFQDAKQASCNLYGREELTSTNMNKRKKGSAQEMTGQNVLLSGTQLVSDYDSCAGGNVHPSKMNKRKRKGEIAEDSSVLRTVTPDCSHATSTVVNDNDIGKLTPRKQKKKKKKEQEENEDPVTTDVSCSMVNLFQETEENKTKERKCRGKIKTKNKKALEDLVAQQATDSPCLDTPGSVYLGDKAPKCREKIKTKNKVLEASNEVEIPQATDFLSSSLSGTSVAVYPKEKERKHRKKHKTKNKNVLRDPDEVET